MLRLIASSQMTPRVKGGNDSVIPCVALGVRYCLLGGIIYLCGVGTTGKLLCPLLSTERTAKITLSFEISIFAIRRWFFPDSMSKNFTCILGSTFHGPASVARDRISSSTEPVEGVHASTVLLSSSLIASFTFCGGAGASASDASVAAFRRATLAT